MILNHSLYKQLEDQRNSLDCISLADLIVDHQDFFRELSLTSSTILARSYAALVNQENFGTCPQVQQSLKRLSGIEDTASSIHSINFFNTFLSKCLDFLQPSPTDLIAFLNVQWDSRLFYYALNKARDEDYKSEFAVLIYQNMESLLYSNRFFSGIAEQEQKADLLQISLKKVNKLLLKYYRENHDYLSWYRTSQNFQVDKYSLEHLIEIKASFENDPWRYLSLFGLFCEASDDYMLDVFYQDRSFVQWSAFQKLIEKGSIDREVLLEFLRKQSQLSDVSESIVLRMFQTWFPRKGLPALDLFKLYVQWLYSPERTNISQKTIVSLGLLLNKTSKSSLRDGEKVNDDEEPVIQYSRIMCDAHNSYSKLKGDCRKK